MANNIPLIKIGLGSVLTLLLILFIFVIPLSDGLTIKNTKQTCDSLIGLTAQQSNKNVMISCHNVNVIYYICFFIIFVSIIMIISGFIDLSQETKPQKESESTTEETLIDDNNPEPTEDDIEHTIKLRYAKGEITKDEMDEMLKNIK